MQALLIFFAFLATTNAQCEVNYFYNTHLSQCILCSNGCLACCDENLCNLCDTGTNLVIQAMYFQRNQVYALLAHLIVILVIKI